jgi:hypothetical protein
VFGFREFGGVFASLNGSCATGFLADDASSFGKEEKGFMKVLEALAADEKLVLLRIAVGPWVGVRCRSSTH